MVFVCNLRNIHSLANVVILFAIKTCQPCHYIKPIARVYKRECHENKNTRFWATYEKAYLSSLHAFRALTFRTVQNLICVQRRKHRNSNMIPFQSGGLVLSNCRRAVLKTVFGEVLRAYNR